MREPRLPHSAPVCVTEQDSVSKREKASRANVLLCLGDGVLGEAWLTAAWHWAPEGPESALEFGEPGPQDDLGTRLGQSRNQG